MNEHSERKAMQSILAPKPIGAYSQALKVGTTIYLSGQIGIVCETGLFKGKDFLSQAEQVFENLSHVADACGASLLDCVKFNVYLIDFEHFPLLNALMEDILSPPFPARSTVQVARLPKDALVEVDAVLILNTHLAM